MAIGKFALPAGSNGGGGGTYSTVVQEYTSSGTWTKPAGLAMIEIVCIAGGGGGGSGSTANTNFSGRAGGSGVAGGVIYATFDESDLGATVSFTIGAGGTGGTAVTAAATSGNSGGNGGNTTFGSLITCLAGGGGIPGGTTGGRSASSETIHQWFRNNGQSSNGIGGAGTAGTTQTNSGTATYFSVLPGGAGGGVSTSNVAEVGGAGCRYIPRSGTLTTAATAGTAGGGAGGAGANNVMDRFCASTSMIEAGQTKFIGNSGAGGGGSVTGNGGNGGAGGLYGGSGGGGGSCRSGSASGAGGAGGAGLIVIVEHIVS